MAAELRRRRPGTLVFDPEAVGFVLRRVGPRRWRAVDYQDLAAWRALTRELTALLARLPGRTVVVPMTVVERAWFDDVVGRLRRRGHDVRVFRLLVSVETARRRIVARGGPADGWAAGQCERCVAALASDEGLGEAVDAETRDAGAVADAVLGRLGASFVGMRGRTRPVGAGVSRRRRT